MLSGRQEIGISGAYGQETLTLVDDRTFSFLPDVTYTYQRFGVDGKLRFGAVGIGLGLGYLAVSEISSSLGQLAHADWFPNAEADGVTVTAGLSYELLEGFAVQGHADYRRYGIDFKRQPSDQLGNRPAQTAAFGSAQPVPVAGGATDAYLGFWAGVSYELPGG
jgi:hypothetical protein